MKSILRKIQDFIVFILFIFPNNISSLPLGKLAVISGPPRGDAKKGGEADENKMAERRDKTARERNWDTRAKTWKTQRGERALKSLGSGYFKSENNIGNLSFPEVDAIVTSPPYAETMQERGGTQHKFEEQKKIGVHYSHNKDNIGNLRFDVVITRPPYAASLEGSSRHTKGGIPSRDAKLCQIGTYPDVVITNPSLKNTWLLLKKAGFQLTKLLKLRLKTQSFWRVLYAKKFPPVPRINHGYILITKKFWEWLSE